MKFHSGHGNFWDCLCNIFYCEQPPFKACGLWKQDRRHFFVCCCFYQSDIWNHKCCIYLTHCFSRQETINTWKLWFPYSETFHLTRVLMKHEVSEILKHVLFWFSFTCQLVKSVVHLHLVFCCSTTVSVHSCFAILYCVVSLYPFCHKPNWRQGLPKHARNDDRQHSSRHTHVLWTQVPQ